jgi:hypothetical protein
MAFAPAWVLDASSVMIAKRYIMGDMPLEAYTNRFSKSLSERYNDTSGDKLLGAVEGIMNFMTTIKGDNVLLVCDAFLYNRVCFESSGAPRKMKTMFRSALAPQKKQTGGDAVVKSFRTFVFRLRSDSSLLSPKAWDPSNVQDLDWLADIFKQRVKITDTI